MIQFIHYLVALSLEEGGRDSNINEEAEKEHNQVIKE